MTFRRLTIFLRFWTEVSPSIWARRSRASESRSMSRSSSRMASAPMPTLSESSPCSSWSLRTLSTPTRSFFLMPLIRDSRQTYSSK